MLVDIRMNDRSSIDMAASAIAAILGLIGVIMFYLGYAGFPELALPAGAGLMLASLVVGAQGYRRKKNGKNQNENAATLMRAIADMLPGVVIVTNLKGEVVFTNASAPSTALEKRTPGEQAIIVAGNRNPGAGGPHADRACPSHQSKPASTPMRMPWHDEKGAILGWVEISTAPRPLSSAQEAPLESQLEALVVQRTAQIREVLAHTEASREEENKALARKLHGDVGSSLTALSMHLAMLARHLPSDSVVKERMQQMKELLSSAVATTRCIQSALRPDKLDLFGWESAAEDLANQLLGEIGIAYEFHLPNQTLSCAASIEISLYRMLEEALTNVKLHACATRVDITLEEEEEWVRMFIQDNGVGFSRAAMLPGKHGLRRIKERAAYFGGELLIHSVVDQGTKIEIKLPREPEFLLLAAENFH